MNQSRLRNFHKPKHAQDDLIPFFVFIDLFHDFSSVERDMHLTCTLQVRL